MRVEPGLAADRLIAEHCVPEWQHCGGDERIDRGLWIRSVMPSGYREALTLID